MISKLTINPERKKSGECCYPKCVCPRAKKKGQKEKKRKTSRKKLRKYKASKWIDALALRPARCLISSIMEYDGFLPERIIEVFQKYFQQSVQTIYSKKFVAEKYWPKLRSKKMQDWEQHREWLSKRAQPKIDHSELEPRNHQVSFDKLSRYKYLSKPRWPRRKFDDSQEIHFNQAITNVSQAAMKYKITERTLKLARVLDRFKPNTVPTMSPEAPRTECPLWIRVLAVPEQSPVESIREETNYGVSLTYNIRRSISSILEYIVFLPKRIFDVCDEYFRQSVQPIHSKKSVAGKYRPKLMSKKVQNWKQHRKCSEGEQRNSRVPLSRYKFLSKPRWPCRKFEDGQKIHSNQAIANLSQTAIVIKYGIPSEWTLKLVRVLGRFKQNKYIYDYCPAPTVSPKALRAKCSNRITMLAVPKQSTVEPKRKETIHGVAVSALTYNIKERTQFLAKPKPIYVPRVKDEEDAIVIEERDLSEYGVSVAALKYVATNNLLALAKPKQPTVAPPPEIPYVDKQRTKYNIVASALTYKITDRVQKLSKPRHAVRRK